MKVGSKIEELLEESFAKESQANRKFLAFAGKADQEGCLQVAKFFRASAEGAAVQAYNLLLTMKEIKPTRENLENLIREETRELEEVYPDMLRAARDKGNRGAEAIRIYALQVKKFHLQLCRGLLERMDKPGRDIHYYVCPVCGYMAEENLPGKCPVCGARGELFKKIE